jgi:hypothetical protein
VTDGTREPIRSVNVPWSSHVSTLYIGQNNDTTTTYDHRLRRIGLTHRPTLTPASDETRYSIFKSQILGFWDIESGFSLTQNCFPDLFTPPSKYRVTKSYSNTTILVYSTVGEMKLGIGSVAVAIPKLVSHGKHSAVLVLQWARLQAHKPKPAWGRVFSSPCSSTNISGLNSSGFG